MEILGGSHARQRPSAQQVRAVKEGGYKADKIRVEANMHHDAIDVPKAEIMLEIALSEPQNKTTIEVQTKKVSWFQKIKLFWENHIITFFVKP